MKILLLITSLFFSTAIFADGALSKFSRLNNAGLLVVNAQGSTLKETRSQQAFVPASTVKLATAFLALKRYGEHYRFQTNFYFDPSDNTLWVKGSGDPYLVSEELAVIAQQLSHKGLPAIERIGLDTTLFQRGLVLPGTGSTANPYDAVPSALAANFNTVSIKKKNGKVVSSESHTPITPYAKSMKKRFKGGTLRVNTGRNPLNAEKYFAEVLAAFLRQKGMQVGDKIVRGAVPIAQPIYQHSNSKTLSQMIKPMLKYSTNFIANQLALVLAADKYKQPANVQLVKQYMNNSLQNIFQWQGFNIQDGAGLSRQNRLKPSELVDLLKQFKQWKHLLPEKAKGVYAKSGTLNGVSTLAGYLVKGNDWKPFALMINQRVSNSLRNQVATQLRQSM